MKVHVRARLAPVSTSSHGEGIVYEQGAEIGHAEVAQGTIGIQLGGQTYSELIFLQDKAALDRFTDGPFEFSANASAIATQSGAGAASDFDDAVAVFTLPKAGLMLEASIGGQKFSYRPKPG